MRTPVKLHEIKADAEPQFDDPKTRPELDISGDDSRCADDEMPLARSLRTLFSLFDGRHPIKMPKR
jgi:hypothetical protein